MEPITGAATVLLLVALALLPFAVVVGLIVSAIRSVAASEPWLHDDVPAAGPADGRVSQDRVRTRSHRSRERLRPSRGEDTPPSAAGRRAPRRLPLPA